MPRVIVIEFLSLDGVVEDPDGSGGRPFGGWAFRHGPETVAGDKFGLGPLLDTGALLLGRRTWELFAGLWPNRTDPFAMKMNAIDKRVLTRGRPALDAWANSTAVAGGPGDAVAAELPHRDVIVAGSASVVHQLAEQDLVDEWRLLIFPSVLGAGARLFEPGAAPRALRHVGTEPAGAALLTRWARAEPR